MKNYQKVIIQLCLENDIPNSETKELGKSLIINVSSQMNLRDNLEFYQRSNINEIRR